MPATVTVSQDSPSPAEEAPAEAVVAGMGSGRVQAEVPPEVRARLAPPVPTDVRNGWLWTGAIALIAAVLRLVRLDKPGEIIFDETYYAKEGRDLLNHGVEWDATRNVPGLVVHPPLGKWCIALGEWIFGYTPFGWRIASVVAGVIAVIVVTRLARRMFNSTVLGCTAGLLMALDGMHFVTSRTALLDIFLMVFILGSFACLIRDREASRRRWLTALEAGLDPSRQRPRRGWKDLPWWRLSSAALMGAALAVKWSAAWYLLAFLIMIFVWELKTRRVAGDKHAWLDTVIDETGWILAFIGVAVFVYLLSWTGWFLNDNAWDRHWLRDHGKSEPPVLGALYNLWEYHKFMLSFHVKLDSDHPWQSWPWQWLVLGRPVLYYWSDDVPCGADHCVAEITLLGTPLLWWSFIPALIALVWQGIARRDWRAWAILAGVTAGIGPWFLTPDRTMFYFYSLPAEPFLILAVTMTLGMIIGSPTASYSRRLTGILIAAGYVAVIALCFAYFYPIFAGVSLPSDDWYNRMWLGRRWY